MYDDRLEPFEGCYRVDGFGAWAALEGGGILFSVNDVELSLVEGHTAVLCGCMR